MSDELKKEEHHFTAEELLSQIVALRKKQWERAEALVSSGNRAGSEQMCEDALLLLLQAEVDLERERRARST